MTLGVSSRPAGARSIEQILADARARLVRLTPQEAHEETRRSRGSAGSGRLEGPDHAIGPGRPDALLVDIRPGWQRAVEGEIPGALVIERNHLEWRFDPESEARAPQATGYDVRVIVFCSEGYTSSLAAVALHEIGLARATDMVGGFRAWSAAGLPTVALDDRLRA